eukprot:1189328-Prorocentrum_minimum.AAC.4
MFSSARSSWNSVATVTAIPCACTDDCIQGCTLTMTNGTYDDLSIPLENANYWFRKLTCITGAPKRYLHSPLHSSSGNISNAYRTQRDSCVSMNGGSHDYQQLSEQELGELSRRERIDESEAQVVPDYNAFYACWQPRYSSVLVVLSVARWEMRWEASTYTCVEACFPPPECRRSQAL